MKKIYLLTFISILSGTLATARTYTLGSGKWTDATVWKSVYPGNTIKAEDIVIVTGQLTMNTGILVEGTLQVEKGASMIGMKDLIITKSGKFVNNGNTVMNRIVNEGSIQNNLVMEAMNDIDNKGSMDNNSSMIAGNDFNNFGGGANGTSGDYFINNNLLTSIGSSFGENVRVKVGNEIENSEKPANNASPFVLNTSFNLIGVELSIENPKKIDVVSYSIERSTDGKNYKKVDAINVDETGETASYIDNNANHELIYYRVTATDKQGKETQLPISTVHTGNVFSTVNE